MTWFNLAATLLAATVVLEQRPAAASAADKSEFEGRWRLNRELSQFPREIGFGVDWVAADGTRVGSTQGGRRGSGGGGGAQPFIARRESVDDAKRLQLLTAEVRNRPNLKISGNVLVDRVLFDGTRATGVVTANGAEIPAGVVILSGGSGTPTT